MKDKIGSTIYLVIILSVIATITWVLMFCINLTLKDQVSIINIAQGFISIIAITTGGYWTYRLFVQKRISEPKLNVTHELICIPLSRKKHLIKVYARLENIGNISITLSSWNLRAEQILPLTESAKELISRLSVFSERESKWNALTNQEDENIKIGQANKTLEPGEIDYAYSNIIINENIDIIQIYSHFKADHPSNPPGWPMQTIVDLRLSDQERAYEKEFTMPGSKLWFLPDDDENIDDIIKPRKAENFRDRFSEMNGSDPKTPQEDERERHEDSDDNEK